MSLISTLLQAMTLEEKIGQLVMGTGTHAITGPVAAADLVTGVRAGRIGSVLNLFGEIETRRLQDIALSESRLRIPLLFGHDVIHGFRTIFPVPLAEAASFDEGLWRRTAETAAAESVGAGLHLTFAPMLDIARDPRWGRICEGPGEDPWVGLRFAKAKIRGFQGAPGERFDPESVAATAKHFVAYGAVTAGRDYAPTDVSDQTLREVYLPPFEAAVRAGVAAIMPSFTDLAGVPLSMHAPLLRDLVRDRWGFDGVMISDYNAVAELLRHGVAADLADAAALALNAGIDIDMMSPAFAEGLPLALERGTVTMETIDASVRRVLRLKERLGLFGRPCRFGSATDTAETIAARRALARDTGRRSIVLLTHHRTILPIGGSGEQIAVIGPLAESPRDMLGSWAAAGEDDRTVTILDGLCAALLSGDKVAYARGCDIDGADDDGISDAVALARGADVVVLCLGEAQNMSGEAACRAAPELPGRQRALAEAILATGTPVIALLSSGRPLMVPWLFERADAVLATWFLGSEAGHAIADVLTGRWAPSAKLPVTWPRAVGQIPIFHAQRNSGRPENPAVPYTSKYLDLPNSPQFPFGHGLSTAEFAYTGLKVPPSFVPGEGLQIEVTLANQSGLPAEETVFAFVRDCVASIARPVMELKGWVKVWLEPGERKVVTLTLLPEAFSFPGPAGAPVTEPGEFEILVGPSADRARCLSALTRLVKGPALA